jgi:hypothetical protein
MMIALPIRRRAQDYRESWQWRQEMRKHITLRSLLIISIVILVGVKNRVTSGYPFPQGATPKTLYDLAKEKGKGGKYIHIIDVTDGVSYPNIEEIAKRSDAIIIGRPFRNDSKMSQDGTAITSYHWVKPQQAIKGVIKRNRAIMVSVPGGTHRYQDGTIVLTHSRFYRQPMKDHVYVLFLKQEGNDPKRWSVVGGSQGQFELDLSNKKVKPGELKKNGPVRVKYKDMSIRQFMREVRRVAR